MPLLYLKMKESEIQEQVIKVLDGTLPNGSLRHHSPNEGLHKPHYRAKQARLGMVSGWPDIEIFVPAESFRLGKLPAPIFIELKSATGRLSDKQRLVLAMLEQLGCYTMVCRSVAEVLEFLKRHVKLKC